jgi:hypothetical protein
MARELEKEAYGHWVSQEFPIVFQRVVDDEEIQVEIDMIASTQQRVTLEIAVDQGKWFTGFVPVVETAVVKKEPPQEGERT